MKLLSGRNTLILTLLLLVFTISNYGQNKRTPTQDYTPKPVYTLPDGTKVQEVFRSRYRAKTKLIFTDGYEFTIDSSEPIVSYPYDPKGGNVPFIKEGYDKVIKWLKGAWGVVSGILDGGNGGGGTPPTCTPTNSGGVTINGNVSGGYIIVNVGCNINPQ